MSGAGHLTYLGVLVCCLLGTAWLEVVGRTRVHRQWRRLLLTLVPVLAVFYAWDRYAVARCHWTFDPALTTGVLLPGGVPLEEGLFFVVIPVCAVLSYEAVSAVLAGRRAP